MTRRNSIFTLLGIATVAAFAVLVLGGSTVAAQDSTDQEGFSAFTARIAEILGADQTEVESAIKQAHEEGYGPKAGMRHHKGGPAALEACLDMDAEELKEVFQDSEGKTMAEVLTELGVEDLDAVAQCVMEDRVERIDQKVEDGWLDEERAAEIKEEIESHMEDFLDHEIGSRMGEMKGRFGEFGRGMHGGTGSDVQ